MTGILKNLYYTLLLLAAVTLISCASPEEKWLADYKAAKCEEKGLNDKVEDEIKKDLKDTLKEKEVLEKDLKQLTAPDEKKIEGFKEALKKSDDDYDKKINPEKELLAKAKTKDEEKALNKKIETLEFQKVEAGKDIRQRIFNTELEIRRKPAVREIREAIKSKDKFIKEKTEERKSKYKGEIKRIQNKILELQKNRPAQFEQESFKKQIEDVDKAPCN